ncbi:MAG TPA: phospholipid carrier-dependent glycosyltransferase, partial [Longimicrobiales bacterium]|nr:phospholipid carrier-dependent glycosyltransferase [Longimicrobiales bacterium]
MLEGGRPLRKEPARWAFRAAVALVGVLTLLPVADWIPGDPGSPIPPPHGPVYALWLAGLTVLVGLAWVGARLWSRTGKGQEPAGKGGRRKGKRRGGDPGEEVAASEEPPSPSVGNRRSRWTATLLVAVPAILYGFTAHALFDARPLHVDGMTQALEARIMADGHLSVPVADDPRFFSSALIIEHEGRAFSQFPPGWAALLALGMLVGLPWLVAPVCGALAVYGLYRLLLENGEAPGTALGAAVLLGLSPWFVVNAAAWMSHVPTLCFILLGSAALLRGMRAPGSARWAALGGAGLGVATLIRPLEGVAFGLPATVWVLARAWRRPGAETRRTLAGFAAGGALTVGLLLA